MSAAAQVSPDDAVARMRHMPFEDLGFAKIDHHRRVRSGMPEVIFAQGKTPAQVAKIFKSMAAQGGNVLATKATAEHFRAVKKLVRKAEYREWRGPSLCSRIRQTTAKALW